MTGDGPGVADRRRHQLLGDPAPAPVAGHRAGVPLLPPGGPGGLGRGAAGGATPDPGGAPAGSSGRAAGAARRRPPATKQTQAAVPRGGRAGGPGRSTFDLDDELTVGRSPGCGVPTTYDVYSSTLHARLFRRGEQLWVEDLGSTNGTLRQLRADHEGDQAGRGDLLQVGATVFEVTQVTCCGPGSATDVGRVRNVNQDLAFEDAESLRGGRRHGRARGRRGGGPGGGGRPAGGLRPAAVRRRSPTRPSARPTPRSGGEPGTKTDLRGMGTTLTAAALVAEDDGRDVIALANVGDSRAYVFSAGESPRSRPTTAWPRRRCATAS